MKACRGKRSFSHVQNEVLAEATCFSQLSCYAGGQLYPSCTQLTCTETRPTILSLNVILVYLVYSVTALVIVFTVESSVCQILFHSFYFPVLLISEETLKIEILIKQIVSAALKVSPEKLDLSYKSCYKDVK